MNKIENEVRDFMENHLGIYFNLRGVEITTQLDFSVCVATDFEEDTNEDVTVGLICICDTLHEFVTVFNIMSLGRVKTIAKKDLLELYCQGKAYMYCSIDGYLDYSLYFLKQGDKMIAKNDDDDEHEVTVLLQTPQQFLEYTRKYYGMPEMSTVLQEYQHTLLWKKSDTNDPGQLGLSIV